MSLRREWENCGAVLFDFDGVLADSEPFYRETWNMTISPARPIGESEYFLRWSFLGQGEQHLTEMGYTPQDKEALRSRQKELYGALCRTGAIPLFPEAAELLSWVSGRKPCIIASNTDSDLVRTVLERGGSPVPAVVGGEGSRHKPDPDIFLRAATVLGVPPGSCLVVEDAWKGIEAARRGGFRAILVRTPHNLGLDAGVVREAGSLTHLFRDWKGGGEE
ncbi:MAG: HAD family phosphatase [Candidatus Fermentibacteraceae bacterium]